MEPDLSHILLTGGTGFFGRSLLRHFLEHRNQPNMRITVLSRDPEKFKISFPELVNSTSIDFLKGDIMDRNSLPWDLSFTHILHAATDSTSGPLLRPIDRFAQIAKGTSNILDLAISTGVKKFLLTSSGGIYGFQPDHLEAIPEDWLCAPPLDDIYSAYSQGKRVAEHLCALYRHEYELQIVIARCFSFVGPDLPLNVHFAIGNFIRDALFSEVINVKGDGTPLRSYLDQRDLSRWLWFLLFNARDGEVFNVGSDFAISIGDLANTIKNLLAPHKSVAIAQSANCDLLASRSRYIPDISKIARVHGLMPSFSLEESIKFTASSIVSGF